MQLKEEAVIKISVAEWTCEVCDGVTTMRGDRIEQTPNGWKSYVVHNHCTGVNKHFCLCAGCIGEVLGEYAKKNAY